VGVGDPQDLPDREDIRLRTFLNPTPQLATGDVIAHFKTSAEFDGGGVFYQKHGNEVPIQRGGLLVRLQLLLPVPNYDEFAFVGSGPFLFDHSTIGGFSSPQPNPGGPLKKNQAPGAERYRGPYWTTRPP